MSQSNITKKQFQLGEAREFAEAGAEARDYTISDNLEEYKTEKAKRIRELRDIFISAGNDAFEFANKIRKGELKNWSTDDLREELKIYKGTKDNGGCEEKGKLALMYLCDKEYAGWTWDRYPDYDKYVGYTWVVLSELEKELGFRERLKDNILQGAYE